MKISWQFWLHGRKTLLKQSVIYIKCIALIYFLAQLKNFAKLIPLRRKAIAALHEFAENSSNAKEDVDKVTAISVLCSLYFKLRDSYVDSINRGDLDDEFTKSNSVGTPTMLVYKQKLEVGHSELESQLKKKKSRQNTEESKMKRKIFENMSQFLDIVTNPWVDI